MLKEGPEKTRIAAPKHGTIDLRGTHEFSIAGQTLGGVTIISKSPNTGTGRK